MRFVELGGSTTSRIVFHFLNCLPSLGLARLSLSLGFVPWALPQEAFCPWQPPAPGREPIHGCSP